ncbi:MAG TPA: hypothetical protein VLA28_09005 [Afifellaceae bacterium]|nr:hypothetical protein [Afifellaceae bacterium]
MRTILTSLAAASALALAASSASAGGGFGFGGCSSSHEQVVESTMPEQDVAMSTFDGSFPVAVEDEAAVTETVCADGDANCQTPPAE